jgi:hypothetical protein
MQKITYQQQPGITYEQELELLASVYRLALESYRKRKAAEQSGRDDTEGRSDGFRADEAIIA